MPNAPRLSELPDFIPLVRPGEPGFAEYVDRVIEPTAAKELFCYLLRRRLTHPHINPSTPPAPVRQGTPDGR